MIGYLYLIVAFIANGVANILLKIGADRGVELSWSLGIAGLFARHAYLIGGLIVFALNVIFYVLALRSFPLSIAYPIMVGMSFLIANGAAVLFLHEPLSWQHLVGYALIIAGITLVASYGR